MEDFPTESPFHGLNISSHSPLKTLTSRYTCQSCHKSSRYFCYRCKSLAPGLSVPNVLLPLEVVVVKHIKELEGKSTAVHAKLLSDEQVTLEMYDPNDEDRMARLSSTLLTSECVLLFPDSTAKTVPEINWSDIKRLVVIDGTWQQAKSMIQSSHLKHLVHHVKLDANNETLFWRYQRLGPHCLSTIEALYRFSQELTLYQTGKVSSELDDLLYFFSFFYGIIQDDYSRNPDRHYTSKHRQDYIKRSKQ